ncbi:MAG: hypothetical protein ACRDH2_15710 [Anaerolineales bacterium]
MRSLWPRPLLAALAGNALGLAAWHSAWALLPRLWAGTDETSGVGRLVGLIAVSAILLAAPPVLVGALGAWLARRAQLWIGLACGLWGLTLIQASPGTLPILSTLWYAPAVLVILSSTLGGWLIDLREQARTFSRVQGQ